MLVDSVEVEFKAGHGGNGIVSWRREKYVAKGGPDGGDGGRGGSVFLVGSSNVDTLSGFRYRKIFQAEDGKAGSGKKKTGHSGEDLELLVPVGTVVTNIVTGHHLGDITAVGQKLLIARGGKGGLGNVHFVSATNQKPMKATEGAPGESVKARLELRLIADLALIGEPNAGKSSLLKALTGVEGRIGPYAFSTQNPLLGVLRIGKKQTTLVDLPGLLEGAHAGRGLGDAFLQHAMRVKGLLHVLDATANVKTSEQSILDEIRSYSEALANLPRQLVINKIDLLSSSELKSLKKQFPSAVFTSASTGNGVNELKKRIDSYI